MPISTKTPASKPTKAKTASKESCCKTAASPEKESCKVAEKTSKSEPASSKPLASSKKGSSKAVATPPEQDALAVTTHAVAKACCHSLVAVPKAQSACSKKEPKTKITVKCNAGFPNNLFIRGVGGHLSWERGLPLKNTSADEWVFECESCADSLEFKIVLNDLLFEAGPNHFVKKGEHIACTPCFSQ